jgi:hypothetical protein
MKFNSRLKIPADTEFPRHAFNWEYRLIYQQFMGGVAPRKIAKEFNISRQRVHDIVKIYGGQRWST